MDQLISDRIRTAKSSGTVRLAEIARRHKEAGHSPIDLAEGEPDFKTPDWVLAAASQAAQDGLTRYTSVPGTSELRRAILNKFSREEPRRGHPSGQDPGRRGSEGRFDHTRRS